jgi:RimJ/RimL family protein N-acetyltransferase
MDDAAFITDIVSDASLWEYEYDISSDKEKARKKVVERLESDWFRYFIIRLDSPEGVAVGLLHIHWYIKERESWEIGYCILPQHRGRGYATEASRIALGYAFGDWNAHKVVGMCNSENTASCKVMEKLGMKREGVFRAELPWRGRWVDQYFYSILDSEYK